MEALPFYKWHWQDWRANRRVQRMPWQAKGPYRELLDEFWAEGSLPCDMPSLADIVGCTVEELQALWVYIGPCFQEREGRLYNAKMDAQRTATDAARVAMQRGGSVGGRKSNSSTRVKGNKALAKGTLKVAAADPDIEEKRRLEKRREEKNALVERSFAYFCEQMKKDPERYTLTDVRRDKALRRIDERLKIRGDDLQAVKLEVIACIKNLAASEFHRTNGHTDWTDQIFRSEEEFQKRLSWQAPEGGSNGINRNDAPVRRGYQTSAEKTVQATQDFIRDCREANRRAGFGATGDGDTGDAEGLFERPGRILEGRP